MKFQTTFYFLKCVVVFVVWCYFGMRSITTILHPSKVFLENKFEDFLWRIKDRKTFGQKLRYKSQSFLFFVDVEAKKKTFIIYCPLWFSNWCPSFFFSKNKRFLSSFFVLFHKNVPCQNTDFENVNFLMYLIWLCFIENFLFVLPLQAEF